MSTMLVWREIKLREAILLHGWRSGMIKTSLWGRGISFAYEATLTVALVMYMCLYMAGIVI